MAIKHSDLNIPIFKEAMCGSFFEAVREPRILG